MKVTKLLGVNYIAREEQNEQHKKVCLCTAKDKQFVPWKQHFFYDGNDDDEESSLPSSERKENEANLLKGC